MHTNKIAIWNAIEESSTINYSFFNLSFGIEYESSYLSITDFVKRSTLLEKYKINENVQCYGDLLTRDINTRSAIRNFKKTLNQQNFFLNTDLFTLNLKKNILLEDEAFNNAEFTITYKIPIQINKENVYNFILDNFNECNKSLETILDNFNEPLLIHNKEFPYKLIYKYHDKKNSIFIYLLNETFHDLKDIFFVPQITIGVEIEKAKELLDILYNLYYYESGNICRDYQECDYLTNEIIKDYPEWKIMKNYLFLFLYSYLTKNDRKNKMFLFRNLFSVIHKDILGDIGLDVLNQLIIKFCKSSKYKKKNKLLEYFNIVHYDTEQYEIIELKRLQNMNYSTIISEPNRFFIEIRGFNNIFMDIMEELNKNIHFTINNFKKNKNEFNEYFLQIFR